MENKYQKLINNLEWQVSWNGYHKVLIQYIDKIHSRFIYKRDLLLISDECLNNVDITNEGEFIEYYEL